MLRVDWKAPLEPGPSEVVREKSDGSGSVNRAKKATGR